MLHQYQKLFQKNHNYTIPRKEIMQNHTFYPQMISKIVNFQIY